MAPIVPLPDTISGWAVEAVTSTAATVAAAIKRGATDAYDVSVIFELVNLISQKFI